MFQVRSVGNGDGPWTYTVGADDKLTETWTYSSENGYDLAVHGPNGFLRAFKGSFDGEARANLDVDATYDCHRVGIHLAIRNASRASYKVRVFDHYTGETTVRFLTPGEGFEHRWGLEGSFGWYDLTVSVDGDAAFGHRVAGHVETGEDSMTDPALGAP